MYVLQLYCTYLVNIVLRWLSVSADCNNIKLCKLRYTAVMKHDNDCNDRLSKPLQT